MSDVVIGSSGDDFVNYTGYPFGGPGSDRLEALWVDGGTGNDAMRGLVVQGGAHDDQIHSTSLNREIVLRGSANLSIDATEFIQIREALVPLHTEKGFQHYLNGGPGADLLLDTVNESGFLVGSSGNDFLIGAFASGTNLESQQSLTQVDWLIGGEGADTFFLGASQFFGGSHSPSYLNGDNSYQVILDYSRLEGDVLLSPNYTKSVYNPATQTATPQNMLASEIYDIQNIIHEGESSVGIYLRKGVISAAFGPRFEVAANDLVSIIPGLTTASFGYDHIIVSERNAAGPIVVQPGWTYFI